MPQICKNIACFELEIPTGENCIPLEMIDLCDNEIQAMYLFSSTEDVMMFAPVSKTPITALGEVGQFGMFLNLFDADGNYFVRDLASGNFTIESEMAHFVPYSLNRKIDWKKSFLRTFIPDESENFHVLLYVISVDNQMINLDYSDEYHETIELKIENDFQDFCFDDFCSVSHALVTNITFSGRCQGYLELNGTDFRMENIPAHFLEIQTDKGFQLSPADVDLTKSFYKHRSFSRDDVKIILTCRK